MASGGNGLTTGEPRMPEQFQPVRLGLARQQLASELSNGGVGGEAAVVQLQQTHAPGVGLAVLLQAEQESVGIGDVGADQHRPASLEELVEGANANRNQGLLGMVRAGGSDGLMEDVLDGTDGQGIVQEVSEHLGDAAYGAVADQGEAQDQLPQPRLGDGQPEEVLRRVVRWREGVVEGSVGVVELLVDKRAADRMLRRKVADRLAREGIEGKLLPGVQRQGACRRGDPSGRAIGGGAG